MSRSSKDTKSNGWMFLGVTGYLHGVKEFFHKILINYKELIGNFAKEKTGRHHFN